MGENSKIEWATHTFNPWIGCAKVSPGCDRCYAETMAERYGWVIWGKLGVGSGERKRTSMANWKKPVRWNAQAPHFENENGHRQRVFCASLADVFDNQIDEQWRADLFHLIQSTPNLDWLLLTKRPQNITRMLPSNWGAGYRNVWLGTTAEDQAHYDQRWPVLASVPGILRFISYEPAIGPLRLGASKARPDWMIFGGESGAHARICRPDWARDLSIDCRSGGIPFFLKQWGSYASNPLVLEEGLSRKDARQRDPNGQGGKLLDGRMIHEFPISRRPNGVESYD